MIVSFEDGNNTADHETDQRYVIYNRKNRVIRKYPHTVGTGGHSGHVSSTADHHVIFWCEGWTDGGAQDDLGTGNDVYVTSMESDGSNPVTVPVSISEDKRDWWPVCASSHDRTLLLWQRYEEEDDDHSRLCYSIYDPATSSLIDISGQNTEQVLNKYDMAFYKYNAVWLEKSGLFAVNLTAADGNGVLILIDDSGKIIAEKTGFPDFVREAAPAVVKTPSGYTLNYPCSESDVVSIDITGKNISDGKITPNVFKWSSCGTCGFADSKGNVYFAALDTSNFKKGKKTLKIVSY